MRGGAQGGFHLVHPLHLVREAAAHQVQHLELRASKGCKREDFGKYRFHAVEDFDLTFSG